MRECKQVVSLILALILMFSMMSAGVVQTSAAGDDDTIYTNPPYEPALLGDIDRNGMINGNDVYVLKSSIARRSGYIDYGVLTPSDLDFKVADCFKDYEEGFEEKIDGNDVYLLRQYIAHKAEAQDKGIGEPVYPDPTEPEPTQPEPTQPEPTQPEPTEPAPTQPKPTEPAPTQPKPTEPAPTQPKPTEPAPTQPKPTEPAPTQPKPTEPAPTEPAPTTATITIYGLNGQSETKEFNIGDTFTVYTSLNAADAIGNGSIASVAASQTYTDSVITLTTAVDDEQLFTDHSTVFPVFGNRGMGRLMESGKIRYNASTPGNDGTFIFDSDDDLMIVTTYQVTAGGTGVVRNALTTIAVADDDLTRIVNKGVTAEGVTLTVNATFEKPEPAPTEPAPTQPKPTEPAPTQPKPTEPAPTQPAGDKATVTIYGLDGKSETKEFNVGDTFTVYTTLNTSAYENGAIGSLNGDQTYTNAVLALADAHDEDEGYILNLTEMFPITGTNTVANGQLTNLENEEPYYDSALGGVFYMASKPSVKNPFLFDNNNAILIKTNYTVTAPGTAEIRNHMKEMAIANQDLTAIFDDYQVVEGMEDFRLHASYTWPEEEQPTESKPTEPAPTQPKPTEPAPTQPKPTEPAPTQPKPTEPAPTQPKPTEPAPTQPKPTEPAPTQPKPTEPAPTQPKPTEPTPTQPKPTEPAPTQPKPTEPAPTQPAGDKATVTIYGLGDQSETKEFNVGDTFTVYTTLNTSAYENGAIGSLNGDQTYTNAVLALADAYDEDEGYILNLTEMFPITGTNTVANGQLTNLENEEPYYDSALGGVFYMASKPSVKNPFLFDNNNAILIKTNYTVTAPGTAEIRNHMKEMAIANQDLTAIFDNYQVVEGMEDFRLHASYTWPEEEQPTEPAPTQPKPTEPAPTQPKPTEPAPTQPKPTEPAPTQPKPTEPAPTQPTGKATVTIYGLGDQSETKEFNVGDTFTVYTTLNTSAYENGAIGSLNGDQTYTNAVLALADAYDEDEGDILNLTEMFPITGTNTVANGQLTNLENEEPYYDSALGGVFYMASKPGVKNPFLFDNNNAILIKTNYTVTAPGTAEIRNHMKEMAIANQDLTAIFDNYQVVEGMEDFRLHASYTWPEEEQPTEPAPTQPKPTEPAPTQPKPTEPAPTQPKPTEPAPTQPAGDKATVTIYGLDGKSETKEFNVGDTFTVYITLNTSAYENGAIGSLNGDQTYTNAVLELADAYDPDEGSIIDLNAMFPVTGGNTMASGYHTNLEYDEPYYDPTLGGIFFLASTPLINNPFQFNDDGDILIKTHYRVTASGNAEVKTTLTDLAIADQPLTRIIENGTVLLSNFVMHASFEQPVAQPTTVQPTEPVPTQPAPTEPAPTQPAPTQPAPTEPAPTEPAVADGYYLVGSITNWQADAQYKFSENTENPGEYQLDVTLAAGDGIKAVKVENGEITTWYPDGMDNEYQVDAAHAGDVTVYFKPSYQSDWSAFGGYIYIHGGSAPSDTITVYFTNSLNWTNIKIYCWDDDDNESMGEWPGTAMTKTRGGDVYSAEIPANTSGIVFNGDGKQTVDITEGIVDGAHWQPSGQMEGANYKVTTVSDTPDPTTPDPTTPSPTTPQPTSAPATEAPKNYVYLNPGVWNTDTPRYELYVWHEGQNDERWLSAEKVGDKYRFEIPAGYTTANCIFVRENPAGSAGSWSSKWNQTGDLELTGNIGKTYTISSWNGDNGNSGGSWS